MKKQGTPKKKLKKMGLRGKTYRAKTVKEVKPEFNDTPEGKEWRKAYLHTKRKERSEDMLRLADNMEEIELATQTAAHDRLQRLVRLREALAQELSEIQMKTVSDYLNDYNGRRAMEMNGYSPITASFATIFRNVKVKKYLAVTRKINEITTGVTGEFVLNEFTKLAKVSAADLYDEDGNIIPPHKLPPDVAAAVSDIKERSWIEGKGIHAKKITEVSYKLHSKLAALDALGKHTGIYEADNKQKATNNKVLIMLPSNGRNKDLLETHDVETRIMGEDGEVKPQQ